MPSFLPLKIKSTLIEALLLLTLAATACTLIAISELSTSFPFELTTHFRMQYLLAGLLGSVVFTITKNRKSLLLAALCVLLNLSIFAAYFSANAGSQPNQPSKTSKLHLFMANIQSSNQEYDAMLTLVNSINPDILVVLELDKTWQQQLSRLHENFPFQILHPRRDNFGIGLYSKFPITSHSEEPLAKNQPPTIVANIKLTQEQLTLIATHPLPPVSNAALTLRNQQLESLAALAQSKQGPLVILGDINTSPWSPYFTKLLLNSGLKNARQGFGILPTWPSNMPLLWTPIDHCLHSKHLQTQAINTSEINGSDHFGLNIELSALIIP